MEDLSRSNGYNTYRSSNRRDDMPERPPSDALVDLHVYLVPQSIWRERYNNFLNQNVTETVSAGIIRVHPEQKVIVLRDEIDTQIGAELVPREYVFLKSVGRSITKLKAKQEYQLKVKNFIPPQSYAPELFLLEAQDVDSSRSSVRPDSPEYTTGRKSDRTPYTSHNTNPTSPEYNMSSAENLTSRHPGRVKHDYSSPYHNSPIPKIPTKNNPDPRRYESMDPDPQFTPDDGVNSYSRAQPYQTPPRGQRAQSPPSREDRNYTTPPHRQDRGLNRSHDPASGRDSDTPTDGHQHRGGQQRSQSPPQRSQSPHRVTNHRSQSPERSVENNRSRSPARQIHQSRSPPRYTTENVQLKDKPNQHLARIDDDNVATPPKHSEHPREIPTKKEQNRTPIREADKPQVKQGRKVASPVHGKDQTNGTSRPLSASWGSDSQKSLSPGGAPPPKQKPQKEAVHGPPLSATPPPLVESSRPVAAANKYDPRLETYTNHTNEDSGIAGLTPEDHYRENQEDVLERRKRESGEKQRRDAELQNRLKADQEERQQKEKDIRDKEWERHEQLEEERRRKDELEKRQREEEKRRKEEEDKQRELDDEAKREQERNLDRLSASDESAKGKILSGRLSSVSGHPDGTSTPNSVKVTVQLNGNRVTDVNVNVDSEEGRKLASFDRNSSTVRRSNSQTTGCLTDREDSGIDRGYHSDKTTPTSRSGQGRHNNTSIQESDSNEKFAENKDSNHRLAYQNDVDGTRTDQDHTQGQGHIEQDKRVNKNDDGPHNPTSEDYQSLSKSQNESNDKVQYEQVLQGGSVVDEQKNHENGQNETKVKLQNEVRDSKDVSESQVYKESLPDQVNNLSKNLTDQSQQSSNIGDTHHTEPVVSTSVEASVEPKTVVSGSQYVDQGHGEIPQPVLQSGALQAQSGNSGSRKTPSRGKHKEVSWSDDVIDNESPTPSRHSNRLDPGQQSSREGSQLGRRSDEVRNIFVPQKTNQVRPGTYTRPQSSFQGPRRMLSVQANSQVSNESPRRRSQARVSQPVVPRIHLDSDSSVDSQQNRQGTFNVVHTPSGWHTQRGSRRSVVPPQDGYQTDVSNQDSIEPPPGEKELNRFPSPPPLKMSTPSSSKGPRESRGGSDTERGQQGKTEKERLMRELELAREARKTTEKQREDLVKKAKLLQNKMQNRRNHARDLWKKRYFEEKKRTSPLEEQCNRLRHELEIIHRKLMNTLEGPAKDKSTQRMGDLKPSLQSNYKIQAARLMHEIEDIRRRLENAKMKLTAEMKLRNQAETELRAMRAELIQKKINRTLTRHQQYPSAISVSDPYLNHTAITPRS
ncbi:zinc finger CCCH domain-containing protein 13-like [Ylistrum balloti]|uniref:zinc finger CCCH domain-containing protein 13-like n=1 Tax=Ylistrum balloti TaxID=509963 RepID=UPI002905F693|nr:zinc finger CCCH domain-containing protein 13-like [Ylistrum balloti]